jgi:hypothetical protein
MKYKKIIPDGYKRSRGNTVNSHKCPYCKKITRYTKENRLVVRYKKVRSTKAQGVTKGKLCPNCGKWYK